MTMETKETSYGTTQTACCPGRAAQAKQDDRVRRLLSVPSIGVMNANALVAGIGNGETFKRSRDLAAWLGLVPKQRTTGGKPKLGAITKRGNRYLRKLLIHGARAALPWLVKGQTPLGAWLRHSWHASLSRWRTSSPGSPGRRCNKTGLRCRHGSRSGVTRRAGDSRPELGVAKARPDRNGCVRSMYFACLSELS